MSAPPLRPPSSFTRVLVGTALVVATLVVYAGVRECGFTEADDPHYVTINREVKAGLTLHGLRWAFTTGHAANWHPLTWLSHMLDVEMFGLDPFGHHLTSVALHAANAVLLLFALERLTRSFWRSAAVAALFAVHPLRVESVAWVAERKDVLCAFFFFLTLLAYARFVERPSLARYAVVALAFAGGLLAKPMLVTTPCVLLLLDLWPLRRLEATRGWPLVREKLPLFALVVLSSLATYWAQRAGGAVQSIETIPVPVRALNAVVSYGRYLQHTFWPSGLCCYYPYPNASQLVPLSISVAVSALVTWLSVRARARHPYLLVGWLWYLGMLVPVIGLVQVGSQAYADRYAYLPTIGVLVAVVWLAAELLERARAPRWVGPALTCALALPCAVVAHAQVRFWRDPVVLFERALAVTRFNSLVHQCLGNVLIDRGRVDEGLLHLREALRISPNFAFAHNGLGAALYTQERFDEAEPHFRRAIELDPVYSVPLYNLGLLLERQGRVAEALECYQRTAEIDPWNAAAFAHAAKLLGVQERVDESLDWYRKALALEPEDIELHRWIAITLTLRGRIEEAIDAYRALLAVQPNDIDALNNIAWIRATHAEAEHRDAAQAVEHAERARDLLPAPNEIVFDTLAAAYAEAGRFEDAVAACERAVEIASAAGDAAAAARIGGHLEQFKGRRPLRGQ